MSFIKTYLITAALGLAVAGGVSILSLHENENRGNGGDVHHVLTPPAATDPAVTRSQTGHSGHSKLFTDAEPTVHADDPLFGRASVLGN